MARIRIETSEAYEMDIDDELYQQYLDGELTKDEVLDEVGEEIWDYNQYADIDNVEIINR